jgi:hypothetical protein
MRCAAGHLHRNLDRQGSTGEQHLGGPARAYRCGKLAGLYRVADQVMPEGRPLPTQQHVRFDKLRGSSLPTPELTTSWQRRAP